MCNFVKPQDMHVLHRAAVGLTAGGIASFMCCPIEVTSGVRCVMSFLSP